MKTLGELEVIRRLGTGRRCRAFLVRREARLLVAKVYRPSAVRRHAARHAQHAEHLAQFEFGRNLALRSVAGLARSVAEPVDLLVVDKQWIFLQEFVEGVRLDRFCENGAAAARDGLLAQLRGIVARAHAAGHYDLDLHPANLLVVQPEPGKARIVLYDFNKVPYHLAPPNRLFGWMVALGLIAPRDRDVRHLRRLQRTMQRSPWYRILRSPSLLALSGQLELLVATLPH